MNFLTAFMLAGKRGGPVHMLDVSLGGFHSTIEEIGVKISADGFLRTLNTLVDPSYQIAQLNYAWVRPTSLANDYQVRVTNLVGASVTFITAPADTWHPLTSGDFEIRDESPFGGAAQTGWDFQFRRGTGPVIFEANGRFKWN